MECKPFNISVLLVAPGAVKSNISNNQASRFSLPSDSLYKSFLHNIIERLHLSQTSNAMPSKAFAKEVVTKALRRNPPSYMTLGGNSSLFSFVKYLPRTWVFWLLWRRFSKKNWTGPCTPRFHSSNFPRPLFSVGHLQRERATPCSGFHIQTSLVEVTMASDPTRVKQYTTPLHTHYLTSSIYVSTFRVLLGSSFFVFRTERLHRLRGTPSPSRPRAAPRYIWKRMSLDVTCPK